MKIDRIEWWEVDQFVHQEMVNSPEYARTHEQWDLVPKHIIRLHTDCLLYTSPSPRDDT